MDPVHHVALLAVLPPLVGYACWRWRGRRSWRRLALSLLLVALGLFLFIPAMMGCGDGGPTYQGLIPTLGVVVVCLAVADRWKRWSMVTALWTAMLLLGTSWQSIADRPTYSGSPKARRQPHVEIRAEWHSPITSLYRVDRPTRTGCVEDRVQGPGMG